MNILATLDGSSESEAILPKAAAIAKDSGANVFLLLVIEPPFTGAASSEAVAEMRFEQAGSAVSQFGGVGAVQRPVEPRPGEHEFRGQTFARVEDEAKDYLADKAEALRSAGLQVQTEVILDEKPANVILDFVKQRNIDLVAMSTHGRSGLSGLIHGSVTGAVIAAGVVPVLVFRPA
jgi:nucleotide-binding universal stress UspA family protein